MPWFLWLQLAQAAQAEQDRQRGLAQEAADRQAAANAAAADAAAAEAERRRQLSVESQQSKQIEEAKNAQEKAYMRLRESMAEKDAAANTLQSALEQCRKDLEAEKGKRTPWVPVAVVLGAVALMGFSK